jgi:DNA-binding XRE family transcriptional regulator
MSAIFFVKYQTFDRVRKKRGGKYINLNEATAFGQRVRELRNLRKMTQVELALEADIDERTVRRIEKAQSIISLDLFFSIAKALQVSPKELLDIENYS